MAKKNLALGRGLGAILSEVEEAYENNLSDNSELVVELDIDSIKPNPFQPRKHFSDQSINELSQSINEHGLLQPILVYEDENNDYVLIAGERRLRASKLSGQKTIKTIIVNIDIAKLREIALIENIQREDLNPIDLANSYKELIQDYQITHEELAKKIKKSRTQITNTLRLLNLSLEVQKALLEEKITQGHAKILVGLNESDQQVILASILGQKLSVRDTESAVRRLKDPEFLNKKPPYKPQLINDKDFEILKRIFNSYCINAKIKSNQIILQCNNKTNINELIKKLS